MIYPKHIHSYFQNSFARRRYSFLSDKDINKSWSPIIGDDYYPDYWLRYIGAWTSKDVREYINYLKYMKSKFLAARYHMFHHNKPDLSKKQRFVHFVSQVECFRDWSF